MPGSRISIFSLNGCRIPCTDSRTIEIRLPNHFWMSNPQPYSSFWGLVLLFFPFAGPSIPLFPIGLQSFQLLGFLAVGIHLAIICINADITNSDRSKIESLSVGSGDLVIVSPSFCFRSNRRAPLNELVDGSPHLVSRGYCVSRRSKSIRWWHLLPNGRFHQQVLFFPLGLHHQSL